MRYSQGNIGATFGRADSLWLVEKNLTGSGTKMFLLPIVPEILKNRGELEVRFGPNSDYLSLNTIGGGWIRHIIPLDSLRNNPTKVNWKRTGDEVLNRDLNFSVKYFFDNDGRAVDSTFIHFHNSIDSLVVKYDFSGFIRKY
jgi:hypothetical protein